MRTPNAYFDALAMLPLPPLLPPQVRRDYYERAFYRDERRGRDFAGETLSGFYLFRVACAVWARREAHTAPDLYALLCFVNERHVARPLPLLDVLDMAQYVARSYSRGPRRQTKRGARRYALVPFDLAEPPEPAWVM